MMTGSALRLLLLLGGSSIPFAAAASVQPEQVIIVTAPRSLPVADRLLGREDIDSYGAGSIGELLEEVIAEEGEDSPVILVNGRRVSGLDELSDFPPEALRQVEVLPVGSGPAVGASPTRKVVNLVLERSFDGRTARAGVRAATEGGWRGVRAEGAASRIRGNDRFNLTLRGRHESRLTESERDLLQPPGTRVGEAEARTLLPSVRALELGLSTATRLSEDVDLSGTGRLTFNRRTSGLGLSLGGSPLEQRSQVIGGRLNSTLNADLAGWTLALLGSFDADRRRVLTDLDAGTRRSLIRNMSGQLDLTAFRPLFDLPAGPLQLNLATGLSAERFTSEVGSAARSRFTERSASASAGLVLPIAGGPDRFLRPLGDLTLSLDAGVTRTVGAGSFRTSSIGLVWQPTPVVRLSAATSRASSPPAARFRREAVIATPGVLTFDPLTGTSVRVTELSGPLTVRLRSRLEQDRLGLSLQPRGPLNLRLESEWSRRRDRDLVGSLPLGSSAVVAAFPERFIRDPSGLLTAVDVSPVLFAARQETQWRNALNVRFNLGRPAPARSSREAGGDEGGEEEAPRGGRPRLQLSLAHMLLLDSKLTLRPGQPAIDLLSSQGLLFAGGRPRHQFDFSANLSQRGMGLRLSADYRSASTVLVQQGGGVADRLRFGALGTVSLRAFAEADRLFGGGPLTKGTRLTLALTNLTGAREEVRDLAGRTPLAYQPDFRDPLGRSVEFEVRRRF